MKKLTLEICTGTSCYLMGGAELLDVLESLPPSLGKGVEVKGTACQGLCRAGAKPPFMKVNGIIMGAMTSERVMDIIKNNIAEGDDPAC